MAVPVAENAATARFISMEKYGFDAEAGDEFVFFVIFKSSAVSKAVSGAYTIISVSLKKARTSYFCDAGLNF